MYISSDWLGPLEDALLKTERKHSGSISMLSDIFNDPHDLVRCYVEPHCRHEDHSDNAGKSDFSTFDAVNLFMGDGVDESIQGGNQTLIIVHRPQTRSLVVCLFEKYGPLKDDYSLMEAVSLQWLIQENQRAQKGGRLLLIRLRK